MQLWGTIIIDVLMYFILYKFDFVSWNATYTGWKVEKHHNVLLVLDRHSCRWNSSNVSWSSSQHYKIQLFPHDVVFYSEVVTSQCNCTAELSSEETKLNSRFYCSCACCQFQLREHVFPKVSWGSKRQWLLSIYLRQYNLLF